MRIVGIFGILLLSLGPGCSLQPVHEPVTVTYLDIEWDTPDLMPGLAKDLQDFTRETGIRVKRLPRPDGSFNQLALWRELLKKGTGTPDVVSIDVIWSGILSQYLLDLKPYFTNELASQNLVVLASYAVGDKQVAVPHHAYIGVLLYRPDLLQKYGYREPPKTWDELEVMATRIQAGERATGVKDFWGYAWQRAARWVGSISPPGVAAYAKWDAQNFWGSGKAAFLRGWQSDYSLLTRGWPFAGSRVNTPPGSPTRFGVTSMPGGRAARAGTLGGNGLAVSQSSTHPREALELIRFLLRRDAQLMRASEHSQPPQEAELYELPALFELYPQLAKLKQHGEVVVARPSVVTGQKYEEVSTAYIRAVHSVLAGEKIPLAAAADL